MHVSRRADKVKLVRTSCQRPYHRGINHAQRLGRSRCGRRIFKEWRLKRCGHCQSSKGPVSVENVGVFVSKASVLFLFSDGHLSVYCLKRIL